MEKLFSIGGIPLGGQTVVIQTFEEMESDCRDFTEALEMELDEVREHKRFDEMKDEELYLMEARKGVIYITVGKPTPYSPTYVYNLIPHNERTILKKMGVPCETQDIIIWAQEKHGENFWLTRGWEYLTDLNDKEINIFFVVKLLGRSASIGVTFK